VHRRRELLRHHGFGQCEPAWLRLSGVLFTGIVTGNNPSTLDVSVYNQILDNRITTGVSALIYDDFSSLALDTPVPPMLRATSSRQVSRAPLRTRRDW